MDYLFNLFLHASTPILMVLALGLITSFLVLPIVKKNMLKSDMGIDKKNNVFLKNYKVLQSFVVSFTFLLCFIILVMYAISPTITPKNSTFDNKANAQRIEREYYDRIKKEAAEIDDSSITTEGARVIMDKSPEQTEKEFNEMMDYTEPMYPEDEKQKSSIDE